MGEYLKMYFFNKSVIKIGLIATFCGILLSGCDLSTPTVSGDNSIIPSNLKRVSYSQLPGWNDDDVRYALQAFRNSCKAKIQYGYIIRLPEPSFYLQGVNTDLAELRNKFCSTEILRRKEKPVALLGVIAAAAGLFALAAVTAPPAED